jgi:hypothetical protein
MAALVSEYEQQRLDNIQRNQQIMMNMGLHEASSRAVKHGETVTVQRKRNKPHRSTSAPVSVPIAEGPSRRSMRLQAIPPPTYSEAVLVRADLFEFERRRSSKRSRSHHKTDVDGHSGEQFRETLVTCMTYLFHAIG